MRIIDQLEIKTGLDKQIQSCISEKERSIVKNMIRFLLLKKDLEKTFLESLGELLYPSKRDGPNDQKPVITSNNEENFEGF